MTVPLRSLFWINFINVAVARQNWNNIGPNIYVYTVALLYSVWFTKKSALSISVRFHKNSLIVPCCIFGRFEIQTLTPNRFKNETNDTLKLLGHSFNHLQGFVKQKVVAPHRCSFNLKVQSCKLYNNKYMIASTQTTNIDIFAFIAVLVFQLLRCKVLFINIKDNRNC